LSGVFAAGLLAIVLLAARGADARRADQFVWDVNNLKAVAGHAVTVIGAPKVVATPAGPVVEFNGATDGLLLDVNPIEGLARFTVEVLFEPAPDGPEEQRFLHISEHGSDRRLMLETRMLPDRTWAFDTYLRWRRRA